MVRGGGGSGEEGDRGRGATGGGGRPGEEGDRGRRETREGGRGERITNHGSELSS